MEAAAGAHTTSAVADTHVRAETPGGKKVKRRRRQRKKDTTPSHVVMATDETVEERKQRLSDEADRADKLARVQAEDRAEELIPDDEETEDEDVFKEQ